MDFVPPRCPNRLCRAHLAPPPRFYRRHGSYRPQCRSEAVPRFHCRLCGRGFSRQTFRLDYRDKRPQLNAPLFALLSSGVGLRQAARVLKMAVAPVQRKFRKIARHLRMLNRNLLSGLPGHRTLLLDEMESFEHRSITPLTIPVLIDRSSKFVIALDVAPIRRVAKKGSRRQRRLERYEAKAGKRLDESRNCVRRVFGRMQRLLKGQAADLVTDEKALYARLCDRRFGRQVHHSTVSSKLPRTAYNPLFAINLTDAMLRDNNGRLRRRSWLVSKHRRFLRLQLEIFAAYRNWHRRRHNDDGEDFTPGVALKLVKRRIEDRELIAWRQDWRMHSIHPCSATGQETVRQAA
jgi:transposase-like protein